jgi:hypothetical protein
LVFLGQGEAFDDGSGNRLSADNPTIISDQTFAHPQKDALHVVLGDLDNAAAALLV